MPMVLNMDNISAMIATICRMQRIGCGIQFPPRADDCEKVECSMNCPIAKMVKEQNEWAKRDFKIRKAEERRYNTELRKQRRERWEKTKRSEEQSTIIPESP